MATAWDVTRPLQSSGQAAFATLQVPTAADMNGDPNAIVTGHNNLASAFNAHASRHATGGADAMTAADVGASAEDYAFFMGSV